MSNLVLNIAPDKSSRRMRGQAAVETALGSLLLCLLLVAAVDYGRAFYTVVVVTNMAGEGAAYASLFPNRDQYPTDASCPPFETTKTIQWRARMVARERGLSIEREDQESASILITTMTPNGPSANCQDRCAGRTITVEVVYRLNDLLLPGFLGVSDIPITRSASHLITGGNGCP
jgi:hypothetical protein